MANLARHIDVRQEVHLNLDGAVALTRLTAAALDVEAESTGLIATNLGLLRLGEEVADLVEHTGVRRWVGTRGATNRRLINLHQLVQLIQPLHAAVSTRHLTSTVELVAHHLGQDFVDQGGLAGPGNTRNAGQHAEGELHVNLLQVVFASALDRHHARLINRTTVLRHRQYPTTREVRTCQRLFAVNNARRFTLVDDLSTVFTGLWPNVDQPIGLANRVLIMLDHNQGIAQVAQVFQSLD